MVEMRDGRPVAQLLQTDWCTLQPRQNVLVSVGFRVSLELLDFLETGGTTPASYAQVETLETQSSQAKAFLEGLRDLMKSLFEEEGSTP